MFEQEGFKGKARFASADEDYRGADIVVDLGSTPQESIPVLLDVKASAHKLDSHLPVAVDYDQQKRTWIAAFNKVLVNKTSHFSDSGRVVDYYRQNVVSS